MMTNRLGDAASPYLLQHAANPVHWQPWDAAALEQARALEKPILLSIGYAACHWCHVMAHESFENADTAAVMNRLFVNIKVDREERPDLDQIYQSAHQLLTGQPGGWPLTMFLTPDGLPFFGGTYFPDTPRHGRPAFADLCAHIAEIFHTRRDDIQRQNMGLAQALKQTLPRAMDGCELDAQPLAAAREELLAQFDARHGGFGGAPKFPHPTDIAFLLRQDETARAAALHSLRAMAAGGIYDQLGGGFYRYSVDARWEIPHFEKMLYDNAQLLPLYADAWRLTQEPLFARIAHETAGWLMREMQAPAGGFYSSYDADSAGEEGRFYVWDRNEAAALLTPDEWRVAAPHWGFTEAPNFEGRHWHLRVVQPVQAADADIFASARQKLFAARSLREAPGLDDKILTAWNALTIAGMIRAARILDQPAWFAAAERTLEFIRSRLWRAGRLLAAARAERAHLPAYLDDHAGLILALLESLQTGWSQANLDWAAALAERLLSHFEDKAAGGFFFTAADHEALIHRPKPAFDQATPAGNGMAALALQRLGHLLGEPRYLTAARRTLELFRAHLGRGGGSATLLAALEEALTPPTSVHLRGPAAEVEAWQKRLALDWGGLCLALPNGLILPASLAHPESDHVNAWVCSGVSCLPVIENYADLRQRLVFQDADFR